MQLGTSKGVIERPVQHLYPLELQCEPTVPAGAEQQLNPDASIFRPNDKEIADDEETEQL